MAIIIELADLMVLLIFGTLKGVLKRGHCQEFVKTLKHGFIVCFLAVLYLFTVQKGVFFSRFILFLTIGIYFILTYIVRELWKRNIKKGVNSGKRRKLLIVTSSTIADKVIENVEKIGDYMVLTTSTNYASFNELFLKRVFDIICGLLGCILTLIICIYVGPAIYIASPRSIFFLQERVGKNGKKFKMYKFRSMYLDAEERKAELMKHNKLGDRKMFKLDFGPRVIGNKVMWIDHIKQALANLFVKQVWMNFHNS